jgi:HSP20 family protein
MRPTESIAPRRNPFPLADLRQHLDRLIEDFGRDIEWKPLFSEQSTLFSPSVDVVENKKSVKVTAELPGLDAKDIQVEVTRNALVLKGEKGEEKEEEGDSFYRRERRYGSFARQIVLPWEIDPTKVKADASFKNGILTVTVPKPKGATETSKKVPIASN